MSAGASRMASRVRLLALSVGDPDGQRVFSGCSRTLLAALERRGCLHHKANAGGMFSDPYNVTSPPVWLLRKLRLPNIQRRYVWSNMALGRNTRRAERIAAAHPGYNACLLFGTQFMPNFGAPAYCYLDASVAQARRENPWAAFALMNEKELQRLIQYQKDVFGACAAICTFSEYTAASIVEDYGIPREKLCVIGAAPNSYIEPPPHDSYDKQTILFIGREWERKGGPLLLDAFRKVRSALPGARFVVVGCEPAIRESGVEVVGFVHKSAPGGLERLLRYYAEASVFCMMSHFEPFGLVIIEAGNSYVPCVAPDRFAFREMVIDGVTGRVLPDYDVDALADTLIELLRAPETLERMGRAAHEHVRKHFTWDQVADRLLARIEADLAGQAS